MLILRRKEGERVRIMLDPALDPATPIGEVFTRGAIEIVIARVGALYVKLGIEADARLLILRGELATLKKD